jgi:hypothetical protein
MRTRTHHFLSRLPARKRAALVMLFVLVCGGVIAGGSAWS